MRASNSTMWRWLVMIVMIKVIKKQCLRIMQINLLPMKHKTQHLSSCIMLHPSGGNLRYPSGDNQPHPSILKIHHPSRHQNKLEVRIDHLQKAPLSQIKYPLTQGEFLIIKTQSHIKTTMRPLHLELIYLNKGNGQRITPLSSSLVMYLLESKQGEELKKNVYIAVSYLRKNQRR